MKVVCPRTECGRVWDYQGSRDVVTCPSCHRKARRDSALSGITKVFGGADSLSILNKAADVKAWGPETKKRLAGVLLDLLAVKDPADGVREVSLDLHRIVNELYLGIITVNLPFLKTPQDIAELERIVKQLSLDIAAVLTEISSKLQAVLVMVTEQTRVVLSPSGEGENTIRHSSGRKPRTKTLV